MASAADQLAQMNEKHCVVRMGGKVLIHDWEQSTIDPDFSVPTFTPSNQMRQFYANRFIMVEYTDANGQPYKRRENLFKVWNESEDRPTAVGTVIDPTAGRFSGNHLNLWQGFGVAPKQGDWSPIRDHIENVICQSDADYLLKWIAWKVQNPASRPEVAVVLRGLKGTGKGTLIRLLRRLFHHHSLQISDGKHLVGSFNAHMLNCLLLNADEALWPGRKQDEGPLKRLITEPTLAIEPKGVNLFDAPNMLAVILTGNDKWIVPASDDERRYAVYEIADTYRNDFAYFDKLHRCINEGGAAAFLYDMQNWDLGDWHPRRDIPQTAALADQQRESAAPEVLWLGGILEEGRLPLYIQDEGRQRQRIPHTDRPDHARSQLLWKHAQAFDSRLKFKTEPGFRSFLEEYGIMNSAVRTSAGRFRCFPPLQEIRQIFRQKHPWWPEFAEEDQEWQMPSEHNYPFDPEVLMARLDANEEAAE